MANSPVSLYVCICSYMVSVGKLDRAIMIWQVLPMPNGNNTSSSALVVAANT